VRRLGRLAAGALLVAALAAVAAFGYVRGWLVEARSPAALDALLRSRDEVLRPPGPGPFPAVVLFHGCGGLRDTIRDWGRWLRDRGYVAVLVDSLAPRGLAWRDVCAGRALLGAERAGDVWTSWARARRLPGVDPARVAVAGWSHGAWAVMELLAQRADGDLPPSLSRAPDAPVAEIAAQVLFYPYCGFAARSGGGWSEAPPTLMLLAGDDSIVSSGDCMSLGEGLARAGNPVQVHLYPGVDHGFDLLGMPEDWGLAPDEAAAADARERVAAFLAEHLR
jgi:dienelactone hydrolase